MAPLPLVIGITGHRDLRPEDREALEARVRAIFVELQNRYPATPLLLLSPLAEGADRLAARVALACGVRLIVPLPMSQDLYETDFETPASRADFHDLLRQSEAWFELAPAGGHAQKDDHAWRDRQYAQVGTYIVRNSQILIALWDGVDSGLEGGTAQIVRYHLEGVPESDPLACSPIEQPGTGPVYHIVTPRLSNPHPSGEPLTLHKLVPRTSSEGTGVESDRSDPNPWADAVAMDSATPYDRIYERMDTFNKDAIALASKRTAEMQASRTALLPESEAEARSGSLQHDLDCYAKADVLALHFERRSQGTLLALLGLLFGAVILFQIYSIYREKPWTSGQLWNSLSTLSDAAWTWGQLTDFLARPWMLPHLLATLYLACLGSAYVLYRWAKRRDYDSKYFDYRALAEGLRVQIFWRLAGLRDSVADHYLRKQRSELEWIRNAVRVGSILKGRGDDAKAPEPRSAPLCDRLWIVLEYWVADQDRYFQRTAQRFHLANKRLGRLVHGFVLVSLAFAVLKVFLAFTDPIIIFMLLIIATAGLIGVYIKFMALSEHAKRYRWMGILFANAHRRLYPLLEAGRYAEAQAIVRELGREALIENSDWVLLHRERPLEYQPR